MNYIYILQSEKFNKFYIGCTHMDPEIRLSNYHNKGAVRSTKPYIPYELIYSEKFENKNTAFKREWYLKSTKGYIEKKQIIEINKL